jgi:uncharacterized ion transporter superfamily protein YfcC
MGAFLQVVKISGALEAGVGALIQKINGKEIWLIPLLMFLFSIGGTTFGMCEETIPFYAIIIPVMLAAGFDTFTAIMVIIFGAGMGVAGSIINPFVVFTSIDALVKANISITAADGMIGRFIIYFAIVAIAITFVTLYARKVKLDPRHSFVYDLREQHNRIFKFDTTQTPPLNLKRKFTLVIFGLSFLIMILGIIDWDKLIGTSIFEDFDK